MEEKKIYKDNGKREVAVFDIAFAQEMIRRGYQISYVEPHHNEPNRIVFKFACVPGIWKDYYDIMERIRKYGQIWDWELSIWIDGI